MMGRTGRQSSSWTTTTTKEVWTTWARLLELTAAGGWLPAGPIFHNIFDVSSYNAFVIWNKISTTWMPDKRNKRREFLEKLVKALVTPHIQRRERLPRTGASAALVKAVQGAAKSCSDPPEAAAGAGKRRRCQFCPQRTVKQILCAAHVRNTSVKSIHTHLHTVLHVLIRVDWFMFFTFLFCICYLILFLFIVVLYTPCGWGQRFKKNGRRLVFCSRIPHCTVYKNMLPEKVKTVIFFL